MQVYFIEGSMVIDTVVNGAASLKNDLAFFQCTYLLTQQFHS